MIALMLKFSLGHIIGEFILQPNNWIEDKMLHKLKSGYLYAHLAVHACVLAVLLEGNLTYWKAFILIIGSHFILDLTKVYLHGKIKNGVLFGLDQFTHILMLYLGARIYHPSNIHITSHFNPQVLLFVIALALVSFVGAVIMKIIMCQWAIEVDAKADSLNDAGKYIGILEIIFVFVFIILQQWAAIGFLVAAMSVFRFGDLSKAKDRKLTEYILIGTLISFGIAIAIGLAYNYLNLKLSEVTIE